MTMLTIRQISDELNVDPRTVRRWIERGYLKAIRLPSGIIRVEESELERLKRQEIRSQAERVKGRGRKRKRGGIHN